MVNKTILLVKYHGKKMFVKAECFWMKDTIRHIDANTKQLIDSKEVNYRLTALRNAKLSDILGYVENICPGNYNMRIYTDSKQTSPKTFEYISDSIQIVQEIYRFEKLE